MQRDSSKSKGITLTVATKGSKLNMRSYPSYGSVIEELKNKSTVKYYGYYYYYNGEMWYYVQSPSGKTGYVHSDYVKE